MVKYLKILIIGYIFLNIIIFFSSDISILLLNDTLLYLIYILKCNFRSLVSKNFIHFAYQLLTNFAKTNGNIGLGTNLN